MKLYALHTIHRRLPDSPPTAGPEVIEAGRVFNGTKEELDTFKKLQERGGAGASLAAREATAGEIADDEEKYGANEESVVTIDNGDGIRAAATTGQVNKALQTDFERQVEAEKAKNKSAAKKSTSDL